MTGGLAGSGADGVIVLADHPLLLAVPFFVPAIIVAAVIGHLVYRDRRDAAQEQAADSSPSGPSADRPDGRSDGAGRAVPPPRPAPDS